LANAIVQAKKQLQLDGSRALSTTTPKKTIATRPMEIAIIYAEYDGFDIQIYWTSAGDEPGQAFASFEGAYNHLSKHGFSDKCSQRSEMIVNVSIPGCRPVMTMSHPWISK
jgi:hypothetical protein